MITSNKRKSLGSTAPPPQRWSEDTPVHQSNNQFATPSSNVRVSSAFGGSATQQQHLPDSSLSAVTFGAITSGRRIFSGGFSPISVAKQSEFDAHTFHPSAVSLSTTIDAAAKEINTALSSQTMGLSLEDHGDIHDKGASSASSFFSLPNRPSIVGGDVAANKLNCYSVGQADPLSFAASSSSSSSSSSSHSSCFSAGGQDDTTIVKNTSSSKGCWVTIFGFPPDLISYILQNFAECGTIVEHRIPSSGANFIHVRFANEFQAKKALSRNGKLFQGVLLVGIIECTNYEDLFQASSAERVEQSSILRPETVSPSSFSSSFSSSSSRRVRPPKRARTETDWWNKFFEFFLG